MENRLKILSRVNEGASVLALAFGSLLMTSTAALAQGDELATKAVPIASDEAKTSDVADIVVTGSRIASSGFNAPTPVTVLDAARIEKLAVTNVGDILTQLPSFRASSGPATNGLVSTNAGGRFADLRSLGAVRTLVLIDGRRVVPSSVTGTVDLNQMPTALISRIDTVTGGASAAYGSDAVAGVVNIILDTKLTGIRANAQMGISQSGDDRETQLSLAGGASFAGGRGHVVASVEYNDSQGIGTCYARSWCGDTEYGAVSNRTPGVNGLPANLVSPFARASNLTSGGVINSPNVLSGIQFDAAGQPVPFDKGQLYSPQTLYMIGGSGAGPKHPYFGQSLLKLPVRRMSAFTHAEYDLADNVALFGELSYGRTEVNTPSAQTRDTALQISIDNPYIPSSIRSAMIANGLSSFTFGRSGSDLGTAQANVTLDSVRGVVGARGGSDGWKWNGYYQYGQTIYNQVVSNNRLNANFTRAVDAVSGPNGTIICRSTITNPANGCSPLNLFGENMWSAAAKAYSYGTSLQRTKLQQHVAAFDVQRPLFRLPAGETTVAVGGEYRKDSTRGVADPRSEALSFYVANGQTIAGSSEVWEGFVETVAPLVSDVPLVHSFALNGAVRYARYKVKGGSASGRFDATTWKLGATYMPIEAIRFRVTRSRDIRAPNVGELFGSLTQANTLLVDPATGGQVAPFVLTTANAALEPEKADTWTAGIVLTPKGVLSGLRFSADYYDINVDRAITRVGAQVIVNRCAAGGSEFCSFVQRDANGGLVTVTNPLLNVAQLTTRGVDFEADYRIPLAGAGQSINLRLLATYVDNLTTVDGRGSIDRANQTGFPAGGIAGVPRWIGDAFIGYESDRFSVASQLHYIPKGKYDTTLIGPEDDGYSPSLSNSVNVNRLPARLYVNLNFQYKIPVTDGSVEFYGAINNLFDKDPPHSASNSIGTNGILFDVVGRSYRVGIRAKY